MRRALAFGSVLLLVSGGSAAAAAAAQTRVHTESKTKQTGPGPNVVTRTETVTGIVKEYRAGRKIELAGPNDKRYSFDLDGAARIDGPIVVGQMARVDWVKKDGRERVTVVAPYAFGVRKTDGSTKRPNSGTRRLRADPASGAVVGTVKLYTAGRTLTVNGPAGQDYTFDLRPGVAIPGNLDVGRKVRVEYRKSEQGREATAITLVAGGAR